MSCKLVTFATASRETTAWTQLDGWSIVILSQADNSQRISGLAIHSDARFVLVVVTYFTAHVLYRTFLGGALGLDDAEMMLDAQSFRLGYGPQLPLYAWVQALLFQVTGPSLFGLALLKNTLLCGIVLTVYATLRTSFSVRDAALATGALLLLPQISWESQRALTHSVLVSFASVLCFAVVWKLARNPSNFGYIALGAVLAVGGLAKYNFALMPLAVFLAALSLPGPRANFFRRQLLGAILLCLVLLAAPYLWIFQNPDLAFASAHKFNIAAPDNSIALPLASLAAVSSAALNFLVLPGLVVAGLLIFCRRKDALLDEPEVLEQLMRRMIAVALALIALGAVVAGVTEVRDRWLQPVLILSAPAMVLWLLPRLTDGGLRVLRIILVAFAGMIFVALPVHFFKPGADVAARFDMLTPQIMQSLPPESVIFAPQYEAGNLFYQAPDWTVQKLIGVLDVPQTDAVLVWTGGDLSRGAALLAGGFRQAQDWTLADHRTFETPYRFSKGQDIFTLSVARIVQK